MDVSRRIDARDALSPSWIMNASRVPLNRDSVGYLMRNLRNFKSEQLLKRATIGFIISQLATKTEREEMMELFKSLDTDNNGSLSPAEIKEGFVSLFGNEINDIDTEVAGIMKQVDFNGSGEIEYSEFISATLNRQQLLSRERLQIAFESFDLDGNGTISADELKQVLGKFHNYDEGVWENIISEVDLNGDGVIDLSEFTKMMLSSF